MDRFAGIPWGWKPEWETVLLVARLFMAGEIKLLLEGSDLDPAAAVDVLTKAARFKQVSILKRKVADAEKAASNVPANSTKSCFINWAGMRRIT